MRIILTHEQTDFDGIASLLGAHLLDEHAIPLLPRRINRNVRAFLTVYGPDFPFIEPRDLEDAPIEAIYLVDTQSLASVKGMQPNTEIHIIDHHPRRDDLPSSWHVTTHETGAATTIFVEALQERGIHVNPIQATLLLLGIYEDTGSLTYTRTTPRDIRAAAYLLEQGASLDIANNFLNHPLTLAQQNIYDQLRANAQNYTIHGLNIIIATGEATELDEELSTIAHKLRDLLDPDALFLLINTRGGVQLIARSTSDHVDVAQIAAHFQGGGHPRAAAALIKSSNREAIHQELVRILPNYVRPAITVAEIMSSTPHLLSPTTRVQEISKIMQRYGYEGYPVVREGKVIGLVTRRAVDRAIAHKLNLTAESLMEAGEITIHPAASIEELQTLMIDTGWGQIPVVDPRKGKIIGIVTRTDLLKTLAPRSTTSQKRNLAAKLEKTLPPERLILLREIARLAQEKQIALYIVGGFVRDLLLDYPSLDFDLVVEGDAIELAHSVRDTFGGRVTAHKRFGTAKWHLTDPRSRQAILKKIRTIQEKTVATAAPITETDLLPSTLDFITARREFYSHPTALPTVERGSIKLDLHRRDFTINTLALRLDGRHYGELHDYWGGYNDLRQGLVRVLHSLSFVDDPTRILRAIRYEQRYNFKLGKRTLELLLDARPLLARVSGDRIRHEIDIIIQEEKAPQMLSRASELGLLEAIHPDLAWDSWIRTHIERLEAPPPIWNIGPDLRGIPLKRALTYALWFIRLPLSQADRVIQRLKLPRALKELIQAACQLWAEQDTLLTARASQITERLDKTPTLAIYALYLATDHKELRCSLQKYIAHWKHITPKTTGHDLNLRGLPPGPHFKEILKTLRAAWIDGEVTDFQQEAELLDRLVQEVQRKLNS